MSGFIKGLIVGGAVAAAAFMGYAYGTETGHARGTELAAQCRVTVGFGQATFGDQCRFDQVMLGFTDQYLYCADLTVDCPD